MFLDIQYVQTVSTMAPATVQYRYSFVRHGFNFLALLRSCSTKMRPVWLPAKLRVMASSLNKVHIAHRVNTMTKEGQYGQ